MTTTRSVKEAMLRDFGSRDGEFIEINTRIRRRLVELVDAVETHVAVPIQGSGTFAVEAMIGSLVPRNGRLLIAFNGAYGKRIVRIAEYADRSVTTIETAEDAPVSPEAIDATLAVDPAITHVAVVHCETTTGILNPLVEVAAVVAHRGKALLIDAMSSFGALPLSAKEIRFAAVAASSNKCLQGAPGLGFVIVEKTTLGATKGDARALTLDLHEQNKGFEGNGQWRFTPPTHVIAAFDQALKEHEAEGRGEPADPGRRHAGTRLRDPAARRASSADHRDLQDARRSELRFHAFLRRVARSGLRDLYPGKLTLAESFRVGCIGALGADEMTGALAAVRSTMRELGVASGRP